MAEITTSVHGAILDGGSPVARRVLDSHRRAEAEAAKAGKPRLTAQERATVDSIVAHAATTAGQIRAIVQLAASKDPMVRAMAGRMTDSQLDAAGVALGEELIKVSAENVRFIETELQAASLFDAVSDAPSMANTQYAWQYLSGAHTAKITDTLRDVPGDTAVLREGRNTVPLHFLLGGYAYDAVELAQAALSGVSLDAEKQRGALRGIAQLADQIYLTGNSTWGLPGALTQTSIVGANTNNGGGALSGLTAANLLAFWKAAFDAYLTAINLNGGARWKWQVLTSFAERRRVDTTDLGTGYETTVGAQLLKHYAQYGFTGFVDDLACVTAGTGGTQMAMIHPVKGSQRDVAPQRVAVPGLMMAPPNTRFWTTEHAIAMKIAGTVFKVPKATHYHYNL